MHHQSHLEFSFVPGMSCPMNYGRGKDATTTTSTTPAQSTGNEQCPVLSNNSNGGCPVKHDSIPSAEQCPVLSGNSKTVQVYNELINDQIFGQDKLPGQTANLSTERAVSTIRKGDFSPNHQPEHLENWVYPSEQQYFNAMKRKGYNPHEKDVPAILYIHNMVNERGWNQIKQWEGLCANTNPVLQRFVGRPKDLSPKARFMNLFYGYELPFDRHDWFVNRNGKQVRYVIDFYQGKKNSFGTPVSIYLDVRPALDSISSVSLVVSYYYKKYFKPWALPKESQ